MVLIAADIGTGAIGLLGGLVPAALAYIRSTRVARQKVDQQAWDRARGIYDGIIEDLKVELERTKSILVDERHEMLVRLAEANRSVRAARALVDRLVAFIESNRLIVPFDLTLRDINGGSST